jgi:hypothetical protein
MFLTGPGVGGRVIALSALTLACLSLTILYFVRPSSPARPGGGGIERSAEIGRAVDSTLTQHGIGPSAVRTWQVRTADKRFTRSERRVEVGPDFLTLQFNHDLQRRLEPLGARVVATERARENIVTMYIVVEGQTVSSIQFVVRIPGG